MEVYAFTGKSGTGKSHRAMWVARSNNIKYLIDDGLLIGENRIIAGKSAKREATKVASVKTALFSKPEHANEVSAAIREHSVDKILILGTSERMANSIAKSLKLPPVCKHIKIEDVADEKEISTANRIRTQQGKHVIPVPTFEVKKQFSGYFLSPLEVLFGKKHEQEAIQKTIIRPTYSYLGEYSISDKAIVDICVYETKKIEEVVKVLKVRVDSLPSKEINIAIDVALKFPCIMNPIAEKIRTRIWKYVERITALNVNKIDINIKSLEFITNIKIPVMIL